MSRSRVRDAFEEAASAGSSAAAALASAALARLEGEVAPAAEGERWVTAVEVGAGWSGREGQLLGGTAFRENVDGVSYPGPVAVPDLGSGLARIGAEAAIGRWGGALELEHTAGSERVTRALASMRAGPVSIWAGRRGFAAGPSPDGGIVLSSGVAFDGGGITLPDGFGLGPLGTVRGSVLFARMERSGDVRRPLFSAARVTLTPRPWLTVGLNRGTLFGGDGNVEPVSPWNVLLMLGGVTSYLGKDSGFENQVASLDLWMRTGIAGVPLVLYGEWGFDDIGEAWTNVPGLIFGAQLPQAPRVPALSVGVEHVRFAESCCGNPRWYIHRQLGDGWTDRGSPLGHPLGGHGTEWALRIEALPAGGSVHVASRLYRRDRGDENLFRPDWEGASRGAVVRGGWRGPGSIELGGELAVERGSTGWSAWQAEIGLTWRASTAPVR